MKRRRNLLLIASVVIVPFVLISIPKTSLRSSLIQEVLYPLSQTWHIGSSFVTHVWGRYLYLVATAEENEHLRTEVAVLRTKLLLFTEKELELQRLRALLAFNAQYDTKTLAAKVVSRPQVSPFKSVRINRGKSSGLRVGMPVATVAGVVGRVVRVGSRFADVQLLIDSNFFVDVLVQRTRVRTVLRGDLQACRLEIPQAMDLRIGDTIVTSGILGYFPKGIPVGRVTEIKYIEGDVAQQVAVQPWVEYQQLEEVSVFLHRSPYLAAIKL